jgi:WD40 repeat protein
VKTTILLLAALSTSAVAGAEPPRVRPAITALAVSADGGLLVHGSQGGVRIRALQDATEKNLPTMLDHVCALAFSPDGKLLAVAGGSPAEAGIVEVYAWPECRRVGRLEGHEDVVHAVAWLSETKLATGSADRSVRLWSLSDGKCVAMLSGHSGPVLSLAAAANGKWLCSGSGDHTIRVWDPSNGRLVRSLTNHLGAVHALAVRPQQEGVLQLASASEDGSVRIWQPSIGRQVRIVRHPAPVFCLGWSKDGTVLYSGARDGQVRQIDGDSDTILHARKLADGRISSLAIRPHNELIFVGHASGAIGEVRMQR